MKIIAVRRDDRFSPNSVEKDRLILENTCQKLCVQLEQKGMTCGLRWVDEADLKPSDEADLYLSMARLPEALLLLESLEQQGRHVINTPCGVRNCQRSVLEKLMRENKVPTPLAYREEQGGESPCWLKRGDAAAQSKDDVVFCKDDEALQLAIANFKRRGISDYVVSRHMEGDVVKFYGVGDAFFRYFYPTDDGDTKFDDETVHNGETHHYPFDVVRLQSETIRLAQLLQVEVFGGDAIIDSKGCFYIIDFNDWPSFSRCRDEASTAISNLLASQL